MIPKGRLLIIGGAEDTGKEKDNPDMKEKEGGYKELETLQQLLPSKGLQNIEVVTTGSTNSDEYKKKYKAAFKKVGYEKIGFMDIGDKSDARDPKLAKRAEEANAIFFSGGDQFRISTILGGTPLCLIVRERFFQDQDFIVGGTSAGAMVMSKIMIASGGTNEGLLKNDLQTAGGFGLLDNCIIDTHFIKRGRFGRLAQAVITNPANLGIGLGEDTALLIEHGTKATCHGSGTVVIVDGMQIGQTNITDVEDDHPVFVENLIVHMLTKDCRFDINERKLFNPAINPRLKKQMQENK